jgi:hypothetical protein
MAKDRDMGNEVIFGFKNRNKGNGNGQRQPGITPIDFWEQHFTNSPTYNDLEKILELPDTNNFAGILQRGIFRNEDQRIAIVELIDLAEKHNLTRHKQQLRNLIASSQGWYGYGLTSQLQLGIGMGLPGVIREQLQMKKVKNGEDVQQGADFRNEGREKERDMRE